MKHAKALRQRLALLVLVTAVIAGCANATHAGATAGPSPEASGSAPDAGASPAAAQAAASGPAFLGRKFPSQGHTHLTPGEPDDFVYNSNPPTSGPHRELFSDAFVSRTSLPSYVQVHLLEHGNVIVQYNCICPEIAAALAKIAMRHDQQFLRAGETQPTAADVQNAEDQGKAVIVAPYPHMPSRIALTAWTHLGALTTVDQQKIESFINAHLGNPSE